MNLTAPQIRTIVAAFLGWMLDAFDFFLLTFLLKDIANEFGVEVSAVAYALFLTLAMRFVGAFIFGRIGDVWGRRPALMLDILCYSIIGALAAFAPNLWVFLRCGRCSASRWAANGVSACSLAMESIPPQARGLVSGILQCGYPVGFIVAAVAYGLLFGHTFGGYTVGWRAMFLLSVLPAFLVLFYIRCSVPESPAFVASQAHAKPSLWKTLNENWGLAIYMVVLMMCFNLFSHGTQDLYPTFLQNRAIDPATVSWITIVANLGAIAGGLTFGHLSEKIGRVNAITIAALIALPALPLWAYASTPALLALGAFVMQIAVQGAWGVIPPISTKCRPARRARPFRPSSTRPATSSPRTMPRFQAHIAEANGGSYAYALALVAGVVAVAIVVVIRFSPERRGQLLTAH